MTPITTLQERIQKAIDELPYEGKYDRLFDPIRYLMSIGGKRMRPALTLLGCELFGGRIEDAMPAALAVEVFHNFTLMHDDIMDKAPLRRGKATVHEKWDTNTAILSGDAMMIRSYELLCDSPKAHIAELLSIFNTVATSVCEGQQMDLDFEKRDDVEVAEYIEMIRLKTAVLLGGALDLGATIAGAREDDLEHLKFFGEHLGISFQLRDDYLDAFGDPQKFGKQVGGDILADKKTYLLIRALEKSNSSQREQIESFFGPAFNPESKIQSIRSVMIDLKIDDELLSVSEKYYHQAIAHLDAISVAEDRKKALRGIAADLLQRQS